MDLPDLRTIPFLNENGPSRLRAWLRPPWLAYGQHLRLAGEPMLARDRRQDGQQYGQGENIMPPLQAVLRGHKIS